MPEEPVVVTPPSAIYRTIRAATQSSLEGQGGVHFGPIPTPRKRAKWWKTRTRPTIAIALTEELYAVITAVAAQERLSMAGAARSLLALGTSEYNRLITQKILELSNAAQRDC
jgi:hypothetical protein